MTDKKSERIWTGLEYSDGLFVGGITYIISIHLNRTMTQCYIIVILKDINFYGKNILAGYSTL